jgi:hypothetical protein
LRQIKGVTSVKASQLTGSVLIHYDPWRIGQGDLLELFEISVKESSESMQNNSHVVQGIAERILPIVFEAICYFAVRRLLALPLRAL